MIIRATLSALVVAGVLMFSGCSPPPIESQMAQELQSEVQEIAVLTARGDTADAVSAAHQLAARVRSAQAEGRITGERAVMILERVEQLIERLVRSGAAPAPTGVLEPVAGPVVPPSKEAAPDPAPTDIPEPPEKPEPPEPPAPAEPADVPEPVVAEPAPAPVDSSGSSGSGSGSSGSGTDGSLPNNVLADPGNSGSSGNTSGTPGNNAGNGFGPVVPLPLVVVEVEDGEDESDDGGKSRGRGRSSDD